MQYHLKYYRGHHVDQRRERRRGRDRFTSGKCRVNEPKNDLENFSPEVLPELNVCSAKFDPAKALACRNLPLPCPNAKTYNNVSEYYSRTFLKQKNAGNAESRAAKAQVSVLKRNYDWFYSTVGLSRHQGEWIRERIERRRKMRRVSFGKCHVDKFKNAVEVLPESLEPLQSEKVIVKDASGSSYLYLLKNGTVKRAPLKFRNACSPSVVRKPGDETLPARPCKRPVYHYSRNMRRVLLMLKYRERIHTLYSLRQKARQAWLRKNDAKAVLDDVGHASSEVEPALKSSDTADLLDAGAKSPSDSGIMSFSDSSEDTDGPCDEAVVKESQLEDITRSPKEEHKNHPTVLSEKDTCRMKENALVVKESGPEIQVVESPLDNLHDSRKQKSPVCDLKNVIHIKHSVKGKVLLKVITTNHDSNEIPLSVNKIVSKLVQKETKDTRPDHGSINNDHVSDNEPGESKSIQKENTGVQYEETREQMMLRKAREARDRIRQMRQKNSKPKNHAQNSKNASDSLEAASLHNPQSNSSERHSSSNNDQKENAASIFPKNDLQASVTEMTNLNKSSVKPKTSEPEHIKGVVDCVSKQPVKEIPKANKLGQSVLSRRKMGTENAASNPVQVCIDLKMVNVSDSNPTNGAKRVLKDHNTSLTTVKGPNLKTDAWKGFKIPKKKRCHSGETVGRPAKKCKTSVREMTRVLRY